MHIEDLLDIIASRMESFTIKNRFDGLLEDDWYQEFIESVHDSVSSGRPLSTQQAKVVLKIIKIVRNHLITDKDVTANTIDGLLNNPTYRQPPYQSTFIKREVRYVGSNLLAFRFKFDKIVVNQIKYIITQCENQQDSFFDLDNKLWVLSVTKATLPLIKHLIELHRFNLDPDTRAWLKLAEQSIDRPSTLNVDQETELIVANVCDNDFLASWMISVGAEPI